MAVPTSFHYFTLKKVPTSESRVSVLLRVSEFTSVSVVACGGSPHAKKNASSWEASKGNILSATYLSPENRGKAIAVLPLYVAA